MPSRSLRATAGVAAAGAVAFVFACGVSSAAPPVTHTIIGGSQSRAGVGGVVAVVPNFVGDGKRMLAVAAPSPGRPRCTAIYLVPYRRGMAAVRLARGARLVIHGPSCLGGFGIALAAAGDVNKDGRGDLLVGAPLSNAAGHQAGAAYLVYGTTRRGSLRVSRSSSTSMRILGPAAEALFGAAVAGAGDVDRDGYADVVIGAPAASPAGRTGAGSAFAVFGGRDKAEVATAAPSARVVRIDGPPRATGATAAAFGSSVGGGQDLSGDGRSDLIVGAPGFDHSRGSAYGVPVSRGSGVVDVADASKVSSIYGARSGPNTGSGLGYSVSMAPDLNGDGRGEALVGAVNDTTAGGLTGSAYVVFGTPPGQVVETALPLGQAGFKLSGARAGDETGASVAGTAANDGDALAELVVTAPRRAIAYVVRLRAGGDIALGSLPEGVGHRRGGRVSTEGVVLSVGRCVVIGHPRQRFRGKPQAGTLTESCR